jgi:mannose/fructose/N-acetylgalactosamine-specific phosphotransferase system component IID
MGIIEIVKGFVALLFLQSSWSYIGRQTLGVLLVLILLVKKKDPNKKLLKQRIWQSIPFNTNPYCTGIILGIALNQEGDIFKESYVTLQHIFGAIGDEFFWRALRPTLLSFSVLILLIGYFLSINFNIPVVYRFAPLLFLVPYNLLAQGIRFRGLYQGKKYGRNAAVRLTENLRKPISKLHNFLTFIMGMLLVLLPLIFIHSYSGHHSIFAISFLSALIIIILTVISFVAMRSNRASSYLLIGGLLIFLIIRLL